MKRIAKFLLTGINQLLWPSVCVSCDSSIDEDSAGLCKNCWSQLFASIENDYCPKCGRNASRYALVNGKCPECLNENNTFDGLARVGVYSGALRKLILKYKSSNTELKNTFGQMLSSSLQSTGFYKNLDVIVPVPLNWKKRLKRGYNQSQLLAKSIKPPIKICDDLVRIKNTAPQSTLNPTKRRKNVEGAFAIRADHQLAGKRVCLIDDIKTTGATLNECASILKQAGVKEVYALVIAVAGEQKK